MTKRAARIRENQETPVLIRPQPKQMEFLSSPADIAIYGGAAGGGKMLPIDLPILTTDGWSTMGDLKVGDFVFSEKGIPVKVSVVHPITTPEKSYLLTFDDGTQITSCSEHLWLTFTAKDLSGLTKKTEQQWEKRRENRASRASGNKSQVFVDAITERNQLSGIEKRTSPPTGSVKTTQEIYETLRVWKNNRTNHAVPVCEPLEFPESELPLDPYLLGAWLGDGTTSAGKITTADSEIVDEFASAGFEVVKLKYKYGYSVHGLWKILRSIGVAGNKHVPESYLFSSKRQRVALLQGLMDTDGYCKLSGSVEFTNKNENLARSVLFLARSLGEKATLTTGTATLYGKPCGTKYRVKWTPRNCDAFRLSRKLERQNKGAKRRTTKYRYIVDCIPVASVPMRCITVENETGLYLCDTSLSVTHNTYALLLETSRYLNNPKFRCVIFRKTYTQVTAEGGIWQASFNLYSHIMGTAKEDDLSWEFPAGSRVKFSHLQHEKDKLNFQGAEITLTCWDELTHFSESQFFYVALSRSRSTSGIKPYTRATCNPDPDSWVAKFISWWIGDDGYAIPERSGKLRWFIRGENDGFVWADTREELLAMYPDDPDIEPKSVTFIPSSVYDNQELLKLDRGYLSNLKALPLVEREQLLKGNWLIRAEAGSLFNRTWFNVTNEVPRGGTICRFFDFAAKERSFRNDDPDYSAAVKVKKVGNQYYVMDVIATRIAAPLQEKWMLDIVRDDSLAAERDSAYYTVRWEVEPGSASHRDAYRLSTILDGYDAKGVLPPRKDKVERAGPASRQVEAGNVHVAKAPWNDSFLSHMHLQPVDSKRIKHDDICDAFVGAYTELSKTRPVYVADFTSMLNYRGVTN